MKSIAFDSVKKHLLTLMSTILLLAIASESHSSQAGANLPAPYDQKKCETVNRWTLESRKELVVHTAICEGRAVALLSTNTEPTKQGQEKTQVLVDQLILGTLNQDEFNYLPFCAVKNEYEFYDWVGLFRGKARKTYTQKNGGIVAAWSINPNTQRFEVMSAKVLGKLICSENN